MLPDDFAQPIASQLNIRPQQVAAVIELLDSGNTLPFIARYRKEATGGLDEEQLRQTSTLLASLRALEERRQAIIASIVGQERMTDTLRQELLGATSLTALEDIYQPYKPKRRTRASIAREKGLQGLADLILQQPRSNQPAADLARPFLSDSVPSIEEALAGARDIVAETISDHADVRRLTREKALRFATLTSQKAKDGEDPRAVYQSYYDALFRVERLRPHQVLAINRGEAEGVLKVSIQVEERDWQGVTTSLFRPQRQSPLAGQLEEATMDATSRLLLPAIERDVRRALTDHAEQHAIAVFASNLRALLSQPPLAGHIVLGLDPGFRTGSKVAVVDGTGKVLDSATIYPHAPQKQWEGALRTLASLVDRYGVTLVAIGNGTASRETEQLVAELTTSRPELRYLMVNEAGASVYSASPLARAELPDLDVTLRGAVSIARRVQDPLAELVKIEPKAIGVGLYQHDVNQVQLGEALDGVVESVVNQVGVEVNTASPALLTHVSGIGPRLAQQIVAHRDAEGPFPDRKSLLKVAGLGPKSFEQAAGFLRIREGRNPLDASAIHPESYRVAQALLERAGLSADSPLDARREPLHRLSATTPLPAMSVELGVGVPTLQDILEQLVRPGRDPREQLPAPLLRRDVLSMEDLLPGLRLMGTVRNVVDFGAFVDIGVKQDGLLHRSEPPSGTILRVGDVIEVEIRKVEAERGRISLGWVEK